MELWFKRSLQLKTHYNQVFLHTTLSICVRDIKGYSSQVDHLNAVDSKLNYDSMTALRGI